MTQNARPAYTARPGEAVRVFRDADGGFAIGAGRLRIAARADGEDIGFVAAVVEEIGRLAHWPEGEAALRRGDELGLAVVIVRPSPPAHPPNAWAVPDDLAAATTAGTPLERTDGGTLHGTGTGSATTIFYDPADWPEPVGMALPRRAEILLAMIEQANANAAGKSNPSLPDWGVPVRR
jgi:hypothetical protein